MEATCPHCGQTSHYTLTCTASPSASRARRRRLTAILAGVAVLIIGGGFTGWLISTERHYRNCDQMLADAVQTYIEKPESQIQIAAFEAYDQECGQVNWDKWNEGWWKPDW